MFSGIIEAVGTVKDVRAEGHLLRIFVDRPEHFEDLSRGDSVAHDGVCLTLENSDKQTMEFVLAAETLRVTRWTVESLQGKRFNLERALCVGSRLHGHIVTGHVDTLSEVCDVREWKGSTVVEVKVPSTDRALIWTKGSICLNGVSLTINDVHDDRLQVCLVPETLRRTNLGDLEVGQVVNVEFDSLARGLSRFFEVWAGSYPLKNQGIDHQENQGGEQEVKLSEPRI